MKGYHMKKIMILSLLAIFVAAGCYLCFSLFGCDKRDSRHLSKQAFDEKSNQDEIKIEFLKMRLSEETLEKLKNLSDHELLAKYSGYLHRDRTWSLDSEEKETVLTHIRSGKAKITPQGFLPKEFRSMKQTPAWALSVLYRTISCPITWKGEDGREFGFPNVCIEDDEHYYMWFKGRPDIGRIIEKKTFAQYSWRF